MGKFFQVSGLLVALFGAFSLCQAAGVLDVLDNPAVLQGRLNDRVFVQRTVACALDQQPCDAIGNLIKGAIREVITNRCGRCTPQQRINAESLSASTAQRYPREWAAILGKYQARRG